jgi:hypothetical protein
MKMNKLKQIPEFLRFVMVGLFATGLHYGIYFVLQKFIQVNVYLGICAEFCCQLLSYGLFYFRAASFLEESFWLRGGTSDKLSDTYRIVESLSAVGFFPSVGSHPSVSHCHSGKFFISEVCFQTKVISLRSLYDSEE